MDIVIDFLFVIAAAASCVLLVGGLSCMLSTVDKARYGDALVGIFSTAAGALALRYVILCWN